MTKARLDGLYLLLLGSVAFILLGTALENAAPAPLVDFRYTTPHDASFSTVTRTKKVRCCASIVRGEESSPRRPRQIV